MCISIPALSSAAIDRAQSSVGRMRACENFMAISEEKSSSICRAQFNEKKLPLLPRYYEKLWIEFDAG
jgi:hypothetical protein